MFMNHVVITNRASFGGVAVLLFLGFAAASCGSDDDADTGAAVDETTTVAEMDMDAADGHADEDYAYEFGDPLDAADAARVIDITAKDDFTFDPATVTVSMGETVTFRVENVGVLPHDFTLGDSDLQEAHEAEMSEMSEEEKAMHEEPNAFALAAGDTREMTWHLTEPGELIFGCHTPGHYEAGMKGTITVEE